MVAVVTMVLMHGQRATEEAKEDADGALADFQRGLRPKTTAPLPQRQHLCCKFFLKTFYQFSKIYYICSLVINEKTIIIY